MLDTHACEHLALLYWNRQCVSVCLFVCMGFCGFWEAALICDTELESGAEPKRV